MSINPLLPKFLFAGVWGIAIGGCTESGDSSDGTGTTTTVLANGGAKNSQSNGGYDSTSTGGMIGNGGNVTQLTTGVSAATGGVTAIERTETLGGSTTSGSKATGGSATTGGTTAIVSGPSSGTCKASVSSGKSVSGSGPHKVVMETNSDTGISTGTIYRPADLGGAEKYPILVWGEGGCSQDGLSNQAAMGEIASHGYFVIADGTPGGTAANGSGAGTALLAYVTWAIAENGKPCSAYYQSLDTTKIAADGFSCGGLMAENASGDPRFTAIGITSSGLFSADQNLYKKIHTPFKILLGGSGDMAYTNGMRDYDQISALGIPILLLSKNNGGHGGDLFQAKGDFNTVNLAWLNWQLKGDETATGKALLVGSSCKYCTASGWEFKSANLP
jgi:hypothetical protein